MERVLELTTASGTVLDRVRFTAYGFGYDTGRAEPVVTNTYHQAAVGAPPGKGH